MRQKSSPGGSSSERLVKSIRQATRRQYSAEEKIRIVLDDLGRESSIAELRRREGIAECLRSMEYARCRTDLQRERMRSPNRSRVTRTLPLSMSRTFTIR